jgi:signal transduction histidine kinase
VIWDAMINGPKSEGGYLSSRTSSRVITPLLLILAVTVPLSLILNSIAVNGATESVSYLVIAPIAAVTLSLVIVELQFRVDTVGRNRWARLLQLAVATATPLWMYTALTSVWSSGYFPVLGSLQTALGYASLVIGLMWVLTGTWGALLRAREARDRHELAVLEAERLNELLDNAERARFLEYRDVIASTVAAPLQGLRSQWSSLEADELASRLEKLTSRVMRPLAHQLHPVSLKVGLVPAIQSLGSHYRLTVPPEIGKLDESGQLLDGDVAPQVFRWVRNLVPSGSRIAVALEIDRQHVVLTAVGVATARTLDPIQQVAGLSVDVTDTGEYRLRAPMHGVASKPHVVLPGRERDARVSSKTSVWDAWTTPPSINLALILYIGIVSVPVFSLVRGERAGVEAPWISILSVLAPVVLAFPLVRIKVARGTRRGAVTVIAMWVGLAIASAIAANLLIVWLAPSTSLFIGNALRILGAVLRYAVVAPMFVLTHGLVVQAQADTQLLRMRQRASKVTRANLLSRADETDRFLAEALHRTVQGRVTAIALLLRLDRRQEAESELDTLTRVTLPELESKLGEWMQVEAEDSSQDREVSGLSVTDSVDWDALGIEDQGLASRLHRVVDEAAINARRHGHATTFEVSMLREGSRVTLICEDNGDGPSSSAVPGLGSAILDDVCREYAGSWVLTRQGVFTRVCLDVRVPAEQNT